jgi:hypothetical protein
MSVEQRFKKVEDYCKTNHIALSLDFDHVTGTWTAWEDQEQLTDAADGWAELVEALESEFSI